MSAHFLLIYLFLIERGEESKNLPKLESIKSLKSLMTAQEYFEKAEALYKQEKYEKILAIIKKAIELDTNNPTFFVFQGKVLKALDKIEEAIVSYKRAIEISPNDADIFNELGRAYLDKGDLNEAIAAYKKAVELNPEYVNTYNNLGFGHYKDKYGKIKTLTAFKKAIKLDFVVAYACNTLGNAYMDKGDLKQAIIIYKKAIELNPEDAYAYANIGNAYKEKGELEKAITAYRKALDIDTENVNIYNSLGNVYRINNELEKAIIAYDKALEINPKDATTYYNLGLTYYDRDRLNEAIIAYKQSIIYDPEYAVTYYNMGIAYYRKGNMDDAILAYQKAIELDTNYTQAYFNLGLAYHDKSEWPISVRKQLAQRYFFKALILQMHPHTLKGYLHIWNAYPKHFFFLQDLFSKLLLSEPGNRELFVQEQVANKCRYINLSLSYYEAIGASKRVNNLEWKQFETLIKYFMGHPQKAFKIFRDEILPNAPTNLQAHYYLIQSCYDFLENEEPYLKQALSIAERVKQPLPVTRRRGILGMGRTKVIFPSKAEILQRYYAALLFKDNNDINAALECIAPIWDQTDYLPLIYLYYGLFYEQAEEELESIDSESNNVSSDQKSLKILIEAPFPKIGRRILELETDDNRERHFAYGFPLHPIDSDREKWWEPFYHYAHYREISSYISLWKLQVENHFNKRKLGIVAGDSLKEFWDCFTIEEVDIIKMQEQVQKYSRQKVGELFLKKTKEHLQEIVTEVDTDPIHLKESIEFVLYESGKTNENSKRAYEELQKMPDKTEHALVYRIASKIEANELGSDLATYYYLNSYFFLSKHLSEKDYIMLNMYATYAQAYQNKGLSKILQGGLKDQFKDMFGTAYDFATVTAVNPVLNLTLGALKSLAKGSMGELFIGMIKDIKFTTMMRYAVSTYAKPPYEKQVLAPSFKEAFLEFVGKEKERLGDRFEDTYPMYGFEEWIEI